MEALDLMTPSGWDDTLARFSSQVSMATCLNDAEGGILGCQHKRYPLCVKIRANEEARSAICSQVSSAMTRVVRATLQSEVGICDAGLLRVSIPVVREGTMVGQITACGLTCKEEDVSTFLLGKMLGLREEQVHQLTRLTPAGIIDELAQSGRRLFRELNPLEESHQATK